jgi:hypothetical protein
MGAAKWCRISIRGLLALVLLARLISWLSVSAIEVNSVRDYHVHTYVDTRDPPSLTAWNRPAPFWPRYIQKLLGRPWWRRPLCGLTEYAEGELCEFAHPEMAIKIGSRVAYNFSSEQGERLKAIEQKRMGRR